MKAVILVGGEGTRLRPLTYTTPKQMLPVCETTMIERVLAHLREHGVEDAVLSLGYRPDAFRAAFPGSQAAGVRLEYAVDPEPLDTAGAIRFAAASARVMDTFVAMNGDVLTDLDVGSLVSLHRSRGAEATLHLTPVSDPSAFGVVKSDSEGWVSAFVEKPAPGEAPSNLINAGTYVLEPSVLERIDPGRKVSIEREIFPALVEERRLLAVATEDYWLDAGTPEQYLRANLDLVLGRWASRPSPSARQLRRGVWVIGEPSLGACAIETALVGDGAEVSDGASLDQAVVGRGARVGESARVSRSVMLPGSAVGAGAVVEGSVLGKEAVVSAAASLSGSVLGDGVTVEAGSRLESVRIPGEAGALPTAMPSAR